jgi:hypothetical protein
VGPRAVLDAVVKRKISRPHREFNPRTLSYVKYCSHRKINFGCTRGTVSQECVCSFYCLTTLMVITVSFKFFLAFAVRAIK